MNEQYVPQLLLLKENLSLPPAYSYFCAASLLLRNFIQRLQQVLNELADARAPSSRSTSFVSESLAQVQGSGFRVQGSGFRVQGSGFRID